MGVETSFPPPLAVEMAVEMPSSNPLALASVVFNMTMMSLQ